MEKCFDRKWEWTTNELMWRNSRGLFLEWVGCREDGEGEARGGGIRSFELRLNGTLKGPRSLGVAGANPAICLATNGVHLWLSGVEIK